MYTDSMEYPLAEHEPTREQLIATIWADMQTAVNNIPEKQRNVLGDNYQQVTPIVHEFNEAGYFTGYKKPLMFITVNLDQDKLTELDDRGVLGSIWVPNYSLSTNEESTAAEFITVVKDANDNIDILKYVFDKSPLNDLLDDLVDKKDIKPEDHDLNSISDNIFGSIMLQEDLGTTAISIEELKSISQLLQQRMIEVTDLNERSNKRRLPLIGWLAKLVNK